MAALAVITLIALAVTLLAPFVAARSGAARRGRIVFCRPCRLPVRGQQSAPPEDAPANAGFV